MDVSASAGLPLIAGTDLQRPIAWRDGQPVSAARFLADAAAQAATLPAAGSLVNLCGDRYRFAVGLAAALQRGHTSLLPPDARPDTLLRLRAAEPSLYGLTDDAALQAAGLPLRRALRGGQSGGSTAAGEGAGSEGAAKHAPAAPPARGVQSGQAIPCVPAHQPAVCLLTSGSTGSPQPHLKTWGTLVRNVGAAAERLAHLMERPSLDGLALVATVPAQHSYGLESTVLLAVLGGAAFDAGRPFYPADIAAALERVPRPRALVTTPFHLRTLLAAGLALPPADLLLCATAPLSPQLALATERAFGAPLVEIYGCTEAGQVATRRTTHGEVWQTFGELRVRCEGGEAGQADEGAERGEQGEGGRRGLRGTRGEDPGRRAGRGSVEGHEGQGPCANSPRFVVQGGHVEAPTPLADVLELVAPRDGRRFRLLGRAGDVVHVAGKRSSLAHLNFHLNSIEGVRDGTFWLPPDVADGVVRPVAFVVAPGVAPAAIVAALRARLEPAFVPRRVLSVDALPREATGKLGAQALERFARARLNDADAGAKAAQ